MKLKFVAILSSVSTQNENFCILLCVATYKERLNGMNHLHLHKQAYTVVLVTRAERPSLWNRPNRSNRSPTNILLRHVETLWKFHTWSPRNCQAQYGGKGLYSIDLFQSVKFVIDNYVLLLVQVWCNCHHRMFEVTTRDLNNYLHLIYFRFPW